MIGLLRRRPFLCLAIGTIALGAVYHVVAGRAPGGAGRPLYVIASVLGAPFILVTQAAHRAGLHPAVAGIVSLAIGIIPYLAADWLLHRWRGRAQAKGVSG